MLPYSSKCCYIYIYMLPYSSKCCYNFLNVALFISMLPYSQNVAKKKSPYCQKGKTINSGRARMC